MVNFLPQQFVAHAQIGDQRFKSLGLFALRLAGQSLIRMEANLKARLDLLGVP